MATIAPSWVQTHPSFMEPENLVQWNQASGAFETLAGSKPRIKLGEGDLYVYIKRLDLRTKMASGQMAYNQLPSCTIVNSMISTATYLLRVRAEYDHHDTAAGAAWGVSVPEAHRLGMRQGHFQLARNGLLYGFNPVNGEGLLNAQGATTISLPADSNGNDTVLTYDNGQMAFFLLTQIQNLKTRTMQLGIGRRFVILGPQQVLSTFEYSGIVNVVQFQREGGGTMSVHGVVENVLEMNGDEVDWVYDDTLIGKGAGGTDAVLIVMPEVEKPEGTDINTNEFAKISPGLTACTMMYADMPAPREIPTPLAGGAIDVLSEWRISSGWAVRPEAVTIVSLAYP